MADTTYTVDPKDERLTSVKTEENSAITKNHNQYNKMINNSDSYFNAQVKATKDWENTQKDIQNEQTEFAIEKINQQKDQAKTDYIKEQSGAYTDWQKQSNKYGANAEAMAAQGMGNTGYSESSQVSMYNAYQNRVATARESYNRAVLNYDNAINEAKLQNNAKLAEIAYESLQKQLELSLAGFQYKNTLITEKAKTEREIRSLYWQKYNDMLGQINTENSLNETARYHDAQIVQAQNELQWEKDKYWNDRKPKSVIVDTDGDTDEKTGGTRIDKKEAPKSLNIGNLKGQKKAKEPTPDMQSVLDLGYGPIGANRLNKLIKDGQVKEYVEGGKLKYKKVFSYR